MLTEDDIRRILPDVDPLPELFESPEWRERLARFEQKSRIREAFSQVNADFRAIVRREL